MTSSAPFSPGLIVPHFPWARTTSGARSRSFDPARGGSESSRSSRFVSARSTPSRVHRIEIVLSNNYTNHMVDIFNCYGQSFMQKDFFLNTGCVVVEQGNRIKSGGSRRVTEAFSRGGARLCFVFFYCSVKHCCCELQKMPTF